MDQPPAPVDPQAPEELRDAELPTSKPQWLQGVSHPPTLEPAAQLGEYLARGGFKERIIYEEQEEDTWKRRRGPGGARTLDSARSQFLPRQRQDRLWNWTKKTPPPPPPASDLSAEATPFRPEAHGTSLATSETGQTTFVPPLPENAAEEDQSGTSSEEIRPTSPPASIPAQPSESPMVQQEEAADDLQLPVVHSDPPTVQMPQVLDSVDLQAVAPPDDPALLPQDTPVTPLPATQPVDKLPQSPPRKSLTPFQEEWDGKWTAAPDRETLFSLIESFVKGVKTRPKNLTQGQDAERHHRKNLGVPDYRHPASMLRRRRSCRGPTTSTKAFYAGDIGPTLPRLHHPHPDDRRTLRETHGWGQHRVQTRPRFPQGLRPPGRSPVGGTHLFQRSVVPPSQDRKHRSWSRRHQLTGTETGGSQCHHPHPDLPGLLPDGGGTSFMEGKLLYLAPQERRRWRPRELEPFALGNTIAKLYTAVLAGRLRRWAATTGQLSKAQKGFMEFEWCLQACFAWLDLENAFGSVPHEHIFNVLDAFGVPEKPIPFKREVKQGCPGSPTLFNVAIEVIVRTLASMAKDHGVCLLEHYVSVLAYADDLLIMAKDKESLQALLDTTGDLAGKIGPHFKGPKCATLHLDCRKKRTTLPTTFCIQEQPISAMREEDRYCHLGKINATKTFIYPRLDFILRGTPIHKTAFGEVDLLIKRLGKKWLGLPQRASNEVLYIPPSKSGAGMMPFGNRTDLAKIQHAFRLLTSPDSEISALDKSLLKRVAGRKLGRPALEEDLVAYLSGKLDCDFAMDGGDITSLWSDARNAYLRLSKKIGVQWVHNPTLGDITIKLPNAGRTPKEISLPAVARRQIMARLRQALQDSYLKTLIKNSNQGKVYEVTCRNKSFNGFINSGRYMRFADWRFIHRARLNGLPLNGAKRFGPEDKRCRVCGLVDETLPHVLQHCRKHSAAVNKRHHNIIERLTKATRFRKRYPCGPDQFQRTPLLSQGLMEAKCPTYNRVVAPTEQAIQQLPLLNIVKEEPTETLTGTFPLRSEAAQSITGSDQLEPSALEICEILGNLGRPSTLCNIPKKTLEAYFQKTISQKTTASRKEELRSLLAPANSNFTSEALDLLSKPISTKEVWTRLSKMSNTAPGPDGLSYADLKRLDPGAKVLTTIFDFCFRSQKTLPQWKESSTVLIYKKRRKKPGKLEAHSTGIKRFATNTNLISSPQKGFLDYEGCLEHNFVLQSLIEETKRAGREICIGCPLSPITFNIYIEPIIRTLKNLGRNLGFKVFDRITTTLSYADDLVITAKNKEALDTLLDALSDQATKAGLKVKPQKCATLHLLCRGQRRVLPTPFKVEGAPVPAMTKDESYLHLGVSTGLGGLVVLLAGDFRQTLPVVTRVGAPVILIRNLDPPRLCNGTRLCITRMGTDVLQARTLTGSFRGEEVLIPRIPIIPNDLPFKFRRLQFPVTVAFAMTINKSQGQTLQVVGVHLESPEHYDIMAVNSFNPTEIVNEEEPFFYDVIDEEEDYDYMDEEPYILNLSEDESYDINVRDSAEFWKIIASFKKRNSTKGNIDISEWESFYQGLLSPPQRIVADLPTLLIPIDSELDAEISPLEIAREIASLNNNKAAGYDSIPNEAIKALPENGLILLSNLFNKIVTKSQVPSQWSKTIIQPIFKNGDPNAPSNYRGIALISNLSKLSNWIENRKLIAENQAGFRRGYSCQDHSFTLTSLIQMTLNRKRMKLYAFFVDLKKAFDTVPHLLLWRKLALVGLSGRFIKLIQNYYAQMMAAVRWNGSFTEFIKIQSGVLQGEPLSPYLFIILINDLVATLDDSDLPVFRNGGRLARSDVWFWGQQPLTVSSKYTYLGYPLTTKNTTAYVAQHFKSKTLVATNAVWRILSKSRTKSFEAVMKLLDSIVLSTLLYSAPMWATNQIVDVNQIQDIFQRRFLDLPKYTPGYILRTETGRMSLELNITKLILKFWIRILKMDRTRLPYVCLFHLWKV
ncbi:hypothetical protein LAZ67_9003287 [Cordylochernes scorpioides]|uniref:Reverse transcriptase domain-containing protein n=1 Tax=Cordylochernes scorpioides TaxID=51811 RepID=A0ABY6KUW9_9ARAC|nr:hypothetical protein LAZ67_9003287 [Cordylochernes scorpioides]